MTAWLGLIGAILGTAIGGIIAYYTAAQKLKHERNLDKDKRLIASFESIHELLSKVSDQASILNIGILGDLGFGNRLKGDLIKEKVPLDRLRMLVDFYAPTIRGEVQEISNQFAIIVRSATEVLLQKERSEDWKGKTVEASAIASVEITNLTKKAQEKLSVLVKPIVEPG